MKWYSVKTHRVVLLASLMIVRVKTSTDYTFISLAEYDRGKWLDWDDKYELEKEGWEVTHFCIPDPVPIEYGS